MLNIKISRWSYKTCFVTLYHREKLEEFVETGVLSHLCVSFSRDVQSNDERSEPAPRYVQDNMRLHKEVLASLVLEQGACVYVCG